MKQLDPAQLQPITNTVEMQDLKQQKKQVNYLGSVKLKKGMSLYEVCTLTLTVSPAQYKTAQVSYEDAAKGGAKRLQNRKILISKPNCVYVQAINKTNALRKATKFIQQKNIAPHAEQPDA